MKIGDGCEMDFDITVGGMYASEESREVVHSLEQRGLYLHG